MPAQNCLLRLQNYKHFCDNQVGVDASTELSIQATELQTFL